MICIRCMIRPPTKSQPYCTECRRHFRDKVERTALRKKKDNARVKARVYLSRGLLIQKPCSKCGSAESEMHHPDYDEPLNVVWLCKKHHREIHRQARIHRSTPCILQSASS